MPRGYRCVIIAVVGWLSLAAAPAPDNTAQPAQPASSAQIERDLDTIANAQGALAKASDPGEYQKPCADGAYNNKSDLCAQWYAARAAGDAAYWAYWAVWVGGLSALGLVITLIFNYLAWHQTREAIDAEKFGQRAWLCGGDWPNGETTDAAGTKAFTVHMKWRNAGPTPAINVELYYAWDTVEADAPIPFFEMQPPPEGERAAIVAPGASVYAGDAYVADPFRERFERGEIDLILYNRASYNDIFAPHTPRISEVCARLKINGRRQGNDGEWVLNMQASPQGPQNTIS